MYELSGKKLRKYLSTATPGGGNWILIFWRLKGEELRQKWDELSGLIATNFAVKKSFLQIYVLMKRGGASFCGKGRSYEIIE